MGRVAIHHELASVGVAIGDEEGDQVHVGQVPPVHRVALEAPRLEETRIRARLRGHQPGRPGLTEADGIGEPEGEEAEHAVRLRLGVLVVNQLPLVGRLVEAMGGRWRHDGVPGGQDHPLDLVGGELGHRLAVAGGLVHRAPLGIEEEAIAGAEGDHRRALGAAGGRRGLDDGELVVLQRPAHVGNRPAVVVPSADTDGGRLAEAYRAQLPHRLGGRIPAGDQEQGTGSDEGRRAGGGESPSRVRCAHGPLPSSDDCPLRGPGPRARSAAPHRVESPRRPPRRAGKPRSDSNAVVPKLFFYVRLSDCFGSKYPVSKRSCAIFT